MKNISRRVFIKGMAVAAVATAASTVLTGCKLPAGVTDVPTGAVNTLPQTKTFTVDGKTFTITAKEFGRNADGSFTLKVEVSNDLGKDVCFNMNDLPYIVASAKLEGCEEAVSFFYSAAVTEAIGSLKDANNQDLVIPANKEGESKTYIQELTLPSLAVVSTIMQLDPEKEDTWTAMTLTLTLVAENKKGEKVSEAVSFTFNRV